MFISKKIRQQVISFLTLVLIALGASNCEKVGLNQEDASPQVQSWVQPRVESHLIPGTQRYSVKISQVDSLQGPVYGLSLLLAPELVKDGKAQLTLKHEDSWMFASGIHSQTLIWDPALGLYHLTLCTEEQFPQNGSAEVLEVILDETPPYPESVSGGSIVTLDDVCF